MWQEFYFTICPINFVHTDWSDKDPVMDLPNFCGCFDFERSIKSEKKTLSHE